nr:MFS transporter [Streptomyces sp. 11-1-2]
MRAWLPDARGHRRLFSALSIDALGTGLFLPFSILYFTAMTELTLGRVGLALSIAALVRIPATAGAGMFCDRFGARSTVIVSNLIQAVGFFNYLFVGSFGHLLGAAVVVQLGNSAFWVAYPALVHDVAEGKRQESWFALITTLRQAGLGVGALGASLAVAIGGVNGYTTIVAVNALSFTVAAILTRLDSSGGAHAVGVSGAPEHDDSPQHTAKGGAGRARSGISPSSGSSCSTSAWPCSRSPSVSPFPSSSSTRCTCRRGYPAPSSRSTPYSARWAPRPWVPRSPGIGDGAA